MDLNYVRRGVFLTCACLFVLAGCAADTPEQLVASGKSRLQQHDASGAAIQLKNALQKNPDNPEARYLLGRAMLETDEFASAEKELRKALELGYPAATVNPVLAHVLASSGEFKDVVNTYSDTEAGTPEGTAELKTALGQSQLALRQVDAAEKSFAAAQAADPKYGPAIAGEAQVLAVRGQLDRALQRLDAATAATPSYPDAWQLKGDILAYQQQSDAAIAAYRKAVEAKPRYLAGHAALVSALLRASKQEEAAKALAAMQAVAPNHPQTYYTEALVRLSEKNYPAARDAVQRYSAKVPDSLSGLLLGANIDYNLRDYVQAEAKLTKVLKQIPGNEYARRLLIATYVASGQTGQALQTLKPLLGRIDKDPAMLNLAGEIYLRNGDPAVAATYFEKAEALDPKGTSQKTGLALTHLAQGDTQRGIEELQIAAASDPGIRPDLVLIASSMQRRDYDKALAAIDSLEKKQPDKPLAANLRGMALLGKKDIAGARKSFEHAVEIDSNFLPAVANLARLEIADKKPADAEKRFQDVISKNPTNSQALLALADLRTRNKGSTEEVVGLMEKAIAAAPSDVSARLSLINYYMRAKNFKKAVAAAEEAQAALPDRPEILDALGQAQIAAGDFNQALATFNRLAEKMPNSTAPLLRVASLKVGLKDYDGAAQALQRALTLQPDLVSAQKGLIVLDMNADKPNQAIAVAQQIQKQRPNEVVGYALEGDIYASRKDWTRAAEGYNKALKRASNTDVAAKLHAVLFAGGKTAEADRAEAAWLKAHPDDTRYQALLADLANQRGDYKSSLKRYEALLAKQPNNSYLLNNAAWAAGKLDDPRGLEYAEKANTLAPNQPLIMDTLGTLLVQKSDAKRGVELLRKASELAPQAASIRLNLAKGLIKVGQKDAARKELDQLAKLGNSFASHEEVASLINSL